MQELQVSVVPSTSSTLVTVSGELDVISAAELSERLEPLRTCPCLLFDLAGLRFIDSTGIRTLLECCVRTRQAGGRAEVCGLSPHLRNLFAVLGLTSRLTIHPSLADALGEATNACWRAPGQSAPPVR